MVRTTSHDVIWDSCVSIAMNVECIYVDCKRCDM
jgi:hypothetical protein